MRSMGIKPPPLRSPSEQWPPAAPPSNPVVSTFNGLRSKLGLGGRDHLAAAAAEADAHAAVVGSEVEVAALAGPDPPATPPPPSPAGAAAGATSPTPSVYSAQSVASAPDAVMLAGSPESSAPVSRELDGRGGWASREAGERKIWGSWKK